VFGGDITSQSSVAGGSDCVGPELTQY
jgi:hypothetical protein